MFLNESRIKITRKHYEKFINPSSVNLSLDSSLLIGNKNDLTLFFICRVGARSYQASQYFIDNGYLNINNIIGGFEGEANNPGARSLISGWQYEKLPWEKLPWEKLPWEKLP